MRKPLPGGCRRSVADAYVGSWGAMNCAKTVMKRNSPTTARPAYMRTRGPRITGRRGSEPDTGIEPSIQHVNRQVHGRDEHRDEHHRALDRREVAGLDALEQVACDT